MISVVEGEVGWAKLNKALLGHMLESKQTTLAALLQATWMYQTLPEREGVRLG